MFFEIFLGSIHSKVFVPVACRSNACSGVPADQPLKKTHRSAVTEQFGYRRFQRAMQPQKTSHRLWVANQLWPKLYRGNRPLGELLYSFLQRREFDEHAAKTASAFAIRMHLAGRQQNEGAWRRGIRTP